MKQDINPLIFRSYDIRGIFPDDLNEKVAYKVARAYAGLYPEAKKIVVARDTRLSSPALAKAVSQGLVEAGKKVIDIGIGPDSLFYFSIFHYGFDGGIMVSGSHNPKEYNGLMLNVRKAGQERPQDIIRQELSEIKDLVCQGSNFTSPAQKKGEIRSFNPEQPYIDYVSKKINLARPLKIVIDSSNGACGFIPEKIFLKLGCQVTTIYGEFDGTFPNHLPDPYEEENLKDIKKKVLEIEADVGFAFDTDGDRVGPIDNKGRRVEGDTCLLLLARQALAKKKGPIVHDMRVSKTLLDEMEREGVETHFSVCHHSNVIKRIIETGAVFGGEITLHFFFPLDYYLYDDAIFSALKIAEIVSQKDNFAQHIDQLPQSHTSPEVFINVSEEQKFDLVDNLVDFLKENNYEFIDIDGARVNFGNGWALVRASNTTPYIKCRFEGQTKSDLLEIEKEMVKIFEKVGIPISKHNKAQLGL